MLLNGLMKLSASPLRRTGQNAWALPLIALSIFLFSRQYPGIVQDAYIYIGRALADLDPQGVGNDLIFVHDGQFGFSVFRFVTKALVALCGPALGAKTLAFAAMLGWFFAAAAFTRQFISGGAVWVVLIFTALLPVSYGAPYPFGFAEPLAIPRPFSEAFVFAALAALAGGRKGLSLSCLIVAGLLHPLMSLPGLGIFLVVLGIENKRWFLFYILTIAALVLGGAIGLPLLDRLFAPVSAIWQLRLFAGPWQYFLDAPAGYANPLLILVKCLLPLPLCVLAAYFAIMKPSVSPRLQMSFALLLFAAAIVFWDQWTPGQRLIEAGHPPAEILQLVNQQQGEVLWIDGSAEAYARPAAVGYAAPRVSQLSFRPPLPANGVTERKV